MADNTAVLQPARVVRAAEVITEQIRGELATGRLTAGQRLPPEREMARQLNVSRTAVREAMGKLEMAGIVERRIGSAGGSFIKASNAQVVARSISDGMTLGRFSISNLAEARLALESFIARKACEVGGDEEFVALERTLDRISALSDERWDEKLEAYREFLQQFIALGHNALLFEMAQPLIMKTADVARKLGPSGNQGIIVIRRRLIAAMRSRSPEQAAKAVHEGIEFIQQGWLARSGQT